MQVGHALQPCRPCRRITAFPCSVPLAQRCEGGTVWANVPCNKHRCMRVRGYNGLERDFFPYFEQAGE